MALIGPECRKAMHSACFLMARMLPNEFYENSMKSSKAWSGCAHLHVVDKGRRATPCGGGSPKPFSGTSFF